ncbi:MAG: EAL domain-containing protein [Betaproteobacteria bacterium]|nr:EAL domain-containing protein [Betaproteobacteria bacterium]
MKPSGPSEQVHDQRRGADGGSRPFALLRYFSLASLLSIVVASVLLAVYFRQVAVNSLVEAGEAHNVHMAHAFINALGPEISPLLAEAKGLSAGQIRALPRTGQVKQAVADHARGLPVVKIKLYSPDGRTIFSSEPSQIGEDRSGNAGFIAAREGRVASELVYRDRFSAFEQVIERADLLSSYVPVVRGSPHRVEAVFELYSDVTPFIQNIRQVEKVATLGVLAVFSVLYAALFTIARRADRLLTLETGRRQQDHQALLDSERRFRQLTGLSSDWYWELDEEFRISKLTAGPHAREWIDHGVGLGKRRWELPYLVATEARWAEHKATLAAHRPFRDFELKRVARDGSLRTISLSGEPVSDARENFKGYQGVGRDITQQKLAEQALRESEERLRLAVEAAELANWDWGIESDRLTWGVSPERLLGPLPPAADRYPDFRDMLHPEDRERFLAAGRRTVAEGVPYHCEFRIVATDGSVRWIAARGQPIRDATGKVARLIGVSQDITERRRAEQALKQSQELLEVFFTQSLDGFFFMMLDAPVEWGPNADKKGLVEYALDHERITRVNSAMCEIYGVPAGRLLGRTPREIFSDDPDYARDCWYDIFEYGHLKTESLFRKADGTPVWAEGDYICLRDAEGRITGHFGVERDVTARRRAEEALRESEQRFRDVVNAGGEYVWEADADWRYTYVSDQFEAMLGYTPSEVLGRKPAEFMPPAEADRVNDWFQERLLEGRLFRGLEHMSVAKSGSIVWQQVSGVPVRDHRGDIVGYRGTGRDITDRRLAEERIEHLATRDSLTGLPNRVLLNDRLDQALLSAQRNGEMVAVLFIDLDRFKTINDSLGHHVGDELLKQVAERLGACVRKGDTLSRLGGDEFVVALEGLRSAQDATIVAEKVLQTVTQPYPIEGHMLDTSCSIGIGIYPADGGDIKTLLRNADTAMYHAKEKGRNNYQFFSHDMNVRVVERLNLESALRRALERDEFVLHYQPQVDLKSGRVVGAEALIRWQHPEKGLVSPATFIPVAEESGLIVPIGEWVLFAACTQGRAWSLQGHDALRMGVNLSVRQLNRDLAKTLAAIVKATDFDPRRLDLEITESLLMRNVEDTLSALDELNRLGVQISIDDFGTGYSSLSYLRRLPIDAVKIDRAFVRDLGISRDDAAIVAAIIAMARSLQIRVIAEGVESPNQLEILGTLQCNEYQGYLFGKPVPAEEFSTRFLSAKAPRPLSSKR